MIEAIGYLGGLFLAICGFPELIRTIKDKKCHLGWAFLLLWFFGEVLMLVYILFKPWDYPLILNYTLNLIMVAVMVYYKVQTYIYSKKPWQEINQKTKGVL